MVNEPSQQEVSSVEMDDLEEMLHDAYDVPDVPRSLLRRLDAQIAHEWGRSPELAATRWGNAARSISRKAAWIRAVPAVAVASMLVFAIAIFTAGTSSGSVWEDMLEALETQNVAQMQIPGGTRWMSLSEGVVIEERKPSATLWNFEQNLLMTRPSDALEPHRRSLSPDSSLTRHDRTVLAFLLGPSVLEETTGLRLTEKRSTIVETAEGRATMLVLSLTDDSGENWELQLTIDEQTHLPSSCEIHRGQQVAELNSLTYPLLPMAEIRQRQFLDERQAASLAEAPIRPLGSRAGIPATSLPQTIHRNCAVLSRPFPGNRRTRSPRVGSPSKSSNSPKKTWCSASTRYWRSSGKRTGSSQPFRRVTRSCSGERIST